MSKRSKAKYPNLDRKLNLKRRQELCDFDYLDKLSEDEKAWLDKFMGEYASASLPKQIVKLKDGTSYKRLNPKNLHKKNQTKDIYDANNSRNRDIYIKKASTNGMEFFDESTLDDLRERDLNVDLNIFEDSIINRDLFKKDPNQYKYAILEYVITLDNKKVKKDTGLTQREEEINYLKANGFSWVFED